MLLRRVIEHVGKQNWIAVVIDFLIVVIGVFIGIQVSNWNEERRERKEEISILLRLSEETQALIESQRRVLARDEDRAQVLLGANPVLFGEVPARPLTERECIWLANSHVLSPPQDELPVLSELLQTARFDLISSPDIKARLREYILVRERALRHFRQISEQPLRPTIRHPEVVHVERVPIEDASARAWDNMSGEGYRWKPVCDVDAMRQNKLFLNEFVDNLNRLGGHIGVSKSRIDSAVAIDETLRSYLKQAPETPVES